jgi:type VI protein secretion system component Hcp
MHINQFALAIALISASVAPIAAKPQAVNAASPAPSGTHKPVTLTKQSNAASPQLLNAHFSASPIPTATGTHKPITVTKQSGAASPALLNAHVTTATPSP